MPKSISYPIKANIMFAINDNASPTARPVIGLVKDRVSVSVRKQVLIFSVLLAHQG